MQARHDNALKRMEQDYDSRMEEQVEDLRDKMRLLRTLTAYVACMTSLEHTTVGSRRPVPLTRL